MGSRRVWTMISSQESSRTVSPLQALFDLEATNAELKSDLRDLYITSAQEVDVSSGRKAIIIHVSQSCSHTMICNPQQPQPEGFNLSNNRPSQRLRNAATLQQRDGQHLMKYQQSAAGSVECGAPWPASESIAAEAAAFWHAVEEASSYSHKDFTRGWRCNPT